MPITWKSKLMLFKAESSYGVDPTPTGAANAVLATNIVLTPMEGDDVSRELEQPYLGAQPLLPVGLRTRIQFRVELVPSGVVGVAPAWGPLLKACGCSEAIVADTSVTYRPITAAMQSGTIWIWHGTTKQVIKGWRGNVTMRWGAQGIAYLEFDGMGLYAEPTDAAQVAPTYTAFKKPLIVTMANTPVFTIDAIPFVMREVVLNLNNQVEPRLLVGSESILIVDRAETLAAKVEATPITTYNPYAEAVAQSEIEVELQHGTVAGAITTLNVPTAQQKRLTGFENAQNIKEWPLDFVPLPASGNDQWSLALT